MKHLLWLLVICIGAGIAWMTGPNVGLGEVVMIFGAISFVMSCI